MFEVAYCTGVPGCTDPLDFGDDSGPAGDPTSGAMINHSLLKAAKEGAIADVRRALGRGAHTETRRPFIMKPENDDKMRMPLDKNRGVGLTPLMHAAHNAHRGVCDLLLCAGANLHAIDEDGMAPLHFAALAGSQECARMLLEYGADSNAKDDEGRVAMAHVPEEYMYTAADRTKWEEVFETKRVSEDELAGVRES